MNGAGSPGIRPGLCSITFRELSVAEVVEVASAAGLHGVEWGADRHVPPTSTAGADEVAARCADAGLACPSYGSYVFAGRTPEAEVVEVCATAATLGASNVRVWAPEEVTAADLASVADRAGDHGLTVSLEYHPGTATETAGGTLALLNAVDRPNLFTYWQPDPGRAVADTLADRDAVADHLSHLHVFTWGPGGIADRRPLADGADRWPTALAGSGSPRWSGDRWAFLEYVPDDDPACLAAEAATLRSWIEDPS